MNSVGCDLEPLRILVVDDEPDIRGLEARILKNAGHHVDMAADSEGAWRALQGGHYHLLVTDYIMPGTSGLALVRQLRVAGVALPVVMVSGNIENLDPARLTRAPWSRIQAFVGKPFSSDRLSIELTRLLASANPLGTIYRFYCRNGTHRVAKWQKMTLPCDTDALAHAAELLQEGFLNVEVVDGVRPVGLLHAH